jgi:hypothetical protein
MLPVLGRVIIATLPLSYGTASARARHDLSLLSRREGAGVRAAKPVRGGGDRPHPLPLSGGEGTIGASRR